MPAVTTVPSSGDQDIDGVLVGRKWAVSSLSYSFPASAAFYEAGYGNGEPLNNFEVLNPTQQAAVRTVLRGYAAVANVTFTEVAETSSAHADLRYASSDAPGTAWAYYPATASYGGDSWYNNSTGWYDSPVKGTYAYETFLHETGHALGLKHAQEAPAVSGAHDSMEYTVMTYHSYVGQVGTDGYTNGAWSFAQSLMMLDIAAVQYLYGANYATNSGNTTYTWSPATGELSIDGVAQGAPIGNRVFMTMWDGGGTDTYDFSSYTTGVAADLHAGAWSTLATAQLAYLGDGHYAAGNVANSLLHDGDLRSLIENATGGAGNDTLTGNELANTLVGNAGDDLLFGDSGNDILDGGAGSDRLFGGAGLDIARFSAAHGAYVVARSGVTVTIAGADGTDTLDGVERLQFTDSFIKLGATLNDFNGDGRSDILWHNADGRVDLWQMNGAQFDATASFGPVATSWVIIDAHGDYDGDGRSDILWRNTDGRVELWRMNGTQRIASASLPGVPTDWSIVDAHGDYNGDGRSDILWHNADGRVDVWQMNGAGLSAGASLPALAASWSIVNGSGDFDGDGRSDIVWRNSDGTVSISLMNGTQIAATGSVSVPMDWSIVDAQGDYNGDGRSDILWRNADGRIDLWQMNGTGVAGASLPAVPTDWNIAAAHGDYDGDGRSDILWRNSDGRVDVWAMDGARIATAGALRAVPVNWTLVDGQGDYNGDGTSDILWRDGSGALTLWQMTGAHIGATGLFGAVPFDWAPADSTELGASLNGDAGANTLTGTVGRDTLFGRGGHDTLTGGAGSDNFVFNSARGPDTAVVTDFQSGTDTLTLSDVVFPGIARGTLSASVFVAEGGAVAHDSDDRILYDSAAGTVAYDADGSGALEAWTFATLANHPLLTAADVHVGVI
ncbi:MAG: peptidase [Betaproteobacteria bacterium]|nr:peptidase [Betaproteobacteria bacterium]